MSALSAAQILSVWETGRHQHPLDRALTMLAAGLPGRPRSELAALPIGGRDRGLLAVRAETLGPVVELVSACPACGDRVEFDFAIADLQVTPGAVPGTTAEIEFAGRSWRFRLPTSVDLAGISGITDEKSALHRLAGQCLLPPGPGDGPSGPEWSAATLDLLQQRMGELDPQAEITLDLLCPACAHHWQENFDIADFFWREIAAQSRQLLQDVDVLARTYGWSEAEILSLSPARRQAYLELAGI